VIQHYALWWGGGGEEQVHNVDYDPVKTVGGKQRKSKRERGDVYTTKVQIGQ
jgi:hypothetical protein